MHPAASSHVLQGVAQQVAPCVDCCAVGCFSARGKPSFDVTMASVTPALSVVCNAICMDQACYAASMGTCVYSCSTTVNSWNFQSGAAWCRDQSWVPA